MRIYLFLPPFLTTSSKGLVRTYSACGSNTGGITPAVIYDSPGKDKTLILKDNKGKSGIYRWSNTITGASYVGSAVDLARRLRDYYSLGFLRKELLKNNSIVYKALLKYGHENFKLEILEVCNKEDNLKREQYYLDLLNPVYNICTTAGSSLGRITTNETRLRLKAARILREYSKNSLKGETLYEYKIRKATLVLEELEIRVSNLRNSLAKLKDRPEFKRPSHVRAKLLASSPTAQKVEVGDHVTGIVSIYPSARSAAIALNCSKSTIMNKLNSKNSRIYKGRYIIRPCN